MREIEFASMLPAKDLFLDELEKRSLIVVNHQLLAWHNAWTAISNVGIYQKGPDVTEVGTTWLSNLKEMQAVRNLSPQEVESMGGKTAFLPASWESVLSPEGRVFGIPWTVDTRLVFFRRDLLSKAGIPEAGAFSTPKALLATARALHESNVARYPLSMDTDFTAIHTAASWIWANGGDFRTPDGHQMTMAEPAALEGLIDYYHLHPYLISEARAGLAMSPYDLFYAGHSAILVASQSVVERIKTPGRCADVLRDNLGVAVIPGGVPFVGGSNLIIWRHSMHDDAALELLRHLTSAEVMLHMLDTGFFPTRTQLHSDERIAQDPLWQVVAENARLGRGLKSDFRWATVEQRVNSFLIKLWNDLRNQPELAVEEEFPGWLKSFCDRLNQTVLAAW